MDALFNDPVANEILAIAGFFPLTTNRTTDEGDLPRLGYVIDWSADGELHAVIEAPVMFSYN